MNSGNRYGLVATGPHGKEETSVSSPTQKEIQIEKKKAIDIDEESKLALQTLVELASTGILGELIAVKKNKRK